MNVSAVCQSDNQTSSGTSELERNNLYEMRMNEFCINYLNRPTIASAQTEITSTSNNLNVTRPKCSISPINLSNDSTSAYLPVNEPSERTQCDSYLHPNTSSNISYVSSPYVSKILQPLAVPIPSVSNYDSGFHQSYENSSSSSSSMLTSSPFIVSNKSAFKTATNRFLMNNLIDNPKKSIRFQSTPNKTNSSLALPEPFTSNHSTIENLPNQSSFLSSSAIKTVTTTTTTTTTRILSSSNRVNFHSIHDLAKSSTSNLSDEFCNKSSDESKLLPHFPEIVPLNSTAENQSSLSFNEQLKFMSQSISNKENSSDFMSKTKRKPRTQITKQQKEILEYAYKLKSYPDSNEVESLCNLLGFEENVIRIWFQNKRARNKQRN